MESVIYVGARARPRRPLWTQLAAGSTAIGLGLFVLGSPGAASPAFLHNSALLWLTFGLINALESVLYQPRRWWYLAAGVLGVVAGVLILGEPLFAASIPTILLYACAVLLALASGVIQLAASVLGDFDPGHLLMGLLQVSLAALAPIFRVSEPAIGVQFVALAALAIGAALLFVRKAR
jgi:uncharacterized membrane protein HdeD (DUF308 family)